MLVFSTILSALHALTLYFHMNPMKWVPSLAPHTVKSKETQRNKLPKTSQPVGSTAGIFNPDWVTPKPVCLTIIILFSVNTDTNGRQNNAI